MAHDHPGAQVSPDGGSADRAELEDLVRRARTGLRAWTDAPEDDPGVALLELFAYVGDLLASQAERVAGEAHLGGGRGGEVEVEVDGDRWHQVEDLAGSGADDPHFVVSRREEGGSVIEFGDGVHGRRPPSDSSVGVRYRRGGGFPGVALQQGRVVLDADTAARVHHPGACGLHRAVVLENVDPLLRRRLLVRVPAVTGEQSAWAAACLPGPDVQVPSVGDGVWIAFEECDPSRPIWLGRIVTD